MKLSEAMKNKMLLSFELFPPKTDKGMENLPGTIEHLCKYQPEYISYIRCGRNQCGQEHGCV